MSNKNFAGQKLDGRSFRGQDLRGADFSGCSLKSCDFRDANLSGAGFYGAIFGVALKFRIKKFAVSLFAGFSVIFFNLLFGIMSVILLGKVLPLSRLEMAILFFICVLSVFIAISTVSRSDKWWLVVVCLFGLISYFGLVRSDFQGSLAVMLAALFVVIAMIVVVGLMFCGALSAMVVSEMGCGAFIGLISVIIFCVFIIFNGFESGRKESFEFIYCSIFPVVMFVTGFFVKRVKAFDGYFWFLWCKRFRLNWECWHGAVFLDAVMVGNDFRGADVRGVDFSGVNLIYPVLARIKNFQWIRAEGSSIHSEKVRALLADGRVIDADFSGLNLRMLSFVGLKLPRVNFCQADLSDADLRDCDLREADLSEATVLGANFERAQLTGATIDQWNTDKRTCFDEVDCEYVYTKRDKSFKNPPHGTFKAGEFSKLYQEIANTVDFIVHTPEELQALLRAIESIKQQGGEIVIQSLERKNESVVVRTQSPEAIDKAAIYAQVREEMDSQIQLLKSEHEKQLLTQRIELGEMYHDKTMDSLIKMASQFNRPSSIIMNDHSRTITNSPITHSAVNLGDHSTVSNNVIEQVADAQLRTDLQKLHDLLTHSTLPADDKKLAQQSVTELAQASEKPAAERKSMARRSLAFLKELREDLGSMADLGVQYGETLARVVLWFQGL